MRIKWTKEMEELRDKIEALIAECCKIKSHSIRVLHTINYIKSSEYKELKLQTYKLSIELNALATKENPEWCKFYNLTEIHIWI